MCIDAAGIAPRATMRRPMRNLSGIVWLLLVGGIALGVGALFLSKTAWGPGGPQEAQEIFAQARGLDAQARSHLEDLGVRYAPPGSAEPTLDLEDPSAADFAFLEGLLSSHDEKARVSAAKVLRDIGAPRSIEPLFASIRGSKPEQDTFLFECAITILEPKPPEVRRATLIPALVRHGASLEPELLQAARYKLRDAGGLDPAFLREAAVSDHDGRVRRFALAELAAAGKPARGLLAAALADPDAGVRAEAAAAFKSQ